MGRLLSICFLYFRVRASRLLLPHHHGTLVQIKDVICRTIFDKDNNERQEGGAVR